MKGKAIITVNLALLAILAFTSVCLVRLVSGSILHAPSEPTLQEWFNENGFTINVTTDETGIETFPAGYYEMTILAEIAAYAPMNNLSWYPVSNGQLNYIFYGENTTGDTVFFTANERFGLSLGSPDGFFYTEPWRNVDGKDHALVFINPNATGYIIAWEDLWNLGDEDFQDLILPIIPEFPSSFILPLFMIATLLTVIVCRRKHMQ